ncbi:MAG: DoxX family protein [Deltaproteobacteria bacterium]|nr:MAG: DoxX family protein [Deltaproteobacteria bacterium]
MIQRTWTWVLHPPVAGPRATVVIRMMAGAVFFWEGILKFVYANQGVGRFTKLGLPFPVFTANFVGGLEIGGGLLLILGLGTRIITIPFIIEMVVAILSTKPRLFLGTLPLPPPPVPPQVGIWAVLHEIRSEYAQIMSCIFLVLSGPGPWSLDASLLSGEEGKRDSLVEATARRRPLTVRHPPEAGEESWSDARRVVRR